MNNTNVDSTIPDIPVPPPESTQAIPFAVLEAMRDLDAHGEPIVLKNARIDKANVSGPFYAKNYISKGV